MSLDGVDNVDIDSNGIYKYILIECQSNGTKKLLVRGYASCQFHADIFDLVEEQLGKQFKLKCIGGGRIRNDPVNKEILIYGYSQGYGQADHTKTVALVKEKYPNFVVNFSNDGY